MKHKMSLPKEFSIVRKKIGTILIVFSMGFLMGFLIFAVGGYYINTHIVINGNTYKTIKQNSSFVTDIVPPKLSLIIIHGNLYSDSFEQSDSITNARYKEYEYLKKNYMQNAQKWLNSYQKHEIAKNIQRAITISYLYFSITDSIYLGASQLNQVKHQQLHFLYQRHNAVLDTIAFELEKWSNNQEKRASTLYQSSWIYYVGFCIFSFILLMFMIRYCLKAFLTEIKKEEHKNEKLKELNVTKTKLITIISHDLRNPFNTMLGFTDILVKNYHKMETEKILRFIKLLNDEAKNAFELLQNLMEWSHSQMNELRFSPEIIDLKLIIEHVVQIVRNQAIQKHITLVNTIQDSYYISADPNYTQTVFLNILTNGIKFTNPGGKIILECSVEENNTVITITDNGIGMNDTLVEKIFCITEKTTRAGTNGEKGTGFGLPLCKELVEKQGGKISVNSKVGEGSNFSVSFPKTDTNL